MTTTQTLNNMRNKVNNKINKNRFKLDLITINKDNNNNIYYNIDILDMSKNTVARKVLKV